MIDEYKLECTIKNIDCNIKNYAKKFEFEKNTLEKQLKHHIHILNERTLSSIINYFLYKKFDSDYNVKLAVNEFPIKLLNTISTSDMSNLLLEVDGEVSKSEWKNCYIDGFFKIENLYFHGDNYLFIEYKLEKKFKLIQLATDYLKYKIYTKNSNKNTIFIFVICDKQEDYPTIINNNDKLFYLLDNMIMILILMKLIWNMFIHILNVRMNLLIIIIVLNIHLNLFNHY